MRIIHANIHTMAGQVIPDGYLETAGGKIAALGEMADCPALCGDEVDAKGSIALPGLIDAHCHIGMWEDGLGFEGDDGNEDCDPCTPQLQGLDAVNPADRAFSEALDWGVTTVVTGPGSANPIAGQMCAMKTGGRRVDNMLLRAPLAIKMAFGENPKTSYHEKGNGPVTRMAIAAMVREQLYKAKRYMADMQRAAEDEDADEPEYDAKCEALLPLLRGQIPAHIHAHRADDIFTGIRIAKEFGLRYVIVHGTEGHLVAQELAAEKAMVITGPLIGARTKPELAQADIAGPGILQANGVQVAICTDHPEVPCGYLMMSARLAFNAGMDKQAALEAVTAQAARICGIERRVGTLAAGKDADILLYRNDPMLVHEKPWLVLLDGKRVR